MQSVIILKSSVMKKLVLLIGVVILSMNVFAQEKGDKYFITTAYASFGKAKIENYNGHQFAKGEQPLNTYLDANVGFGVFAANRFRFQLTVGVPYGKEPSAMDNGQWLFNRTIGVELMPSVAYYFKLAERFYYVMEAGGDFVFGQNTYDVSYYQSEKYDYKLRGAYLDLIGFEARVSQRCALGFKMGQVGYFYRKVSDPVSGAYVSNSQLCFNLNSFYVHALFYL